jgi:hypothetical protein
MMGCGGVSWIPFTLMLWRLVALYFRIFSWLLIFAASSKHWSKLKMLEVFN